MVRHVTPVLLAQLLAALPAMQTTRITIARMVGELIRLEESTRTSFAWGILHTVNLPE